MDNQTHKICLLLDSRELGGIESHVLQLADGLKHHNISIKVVFLRHYPGHPLYDQLQQLNIDYQVLKGSAYALWQALRDEPVSLLHTHGYKAGIYGRCVCKLRGIPVVSSYHAGEVPNGKLALYDFLDRYSAGLADLIFAISPQIAQRLPVNADISDNFINTSNIKTSTGQQIAFVGRLSHEKGPDRFLQLSQQFPQQQFHVYGTGALASSLQKSAPSNVTFHGLQHNMSEVWPKIGLLIMPSRFEGLPMAALEAMARGIPLLASRVGALDKLIQPANPCGGWLVTEGDANELTQRFQHWLELSAQARQSIQLNAQKAIHQNFSSSSAIPKLIAHYTRIINNH